MTGQQTYCLMLSYVESGYMRVIYSMFPCDYANRLVAIHCLLFACLLVYLLPSFHFLLLSLSAPFNSSDITSSSKKKHILIA
jgi:hypothetical protein